jgi:cytochrome P450
MCIGAANRDLRKFNAPEHFDITRRPNRHLAFAAGPHACLGLTLARMEGRAALTGFLKRFPDWAPSGPRPRTGRLRFRGYAHLPARLG